MRGRGKEGADREREGKGKGGKGGREERQIKKRKFNNFVRSKLDEAKENEETFTWSCYNFGVLVRAYYEYGIVPEFVSQCI